jgi:hypothetical protein
MERARGVAANGTKRNGICGGRREAGASADWRFRRGEEVGGRKARPTTTEKLKGWGGLYARRYSAKP